MMRRIVVAAHGSPRVMTTARSPITEPGLGEVLVRVASAGVNFIDVYQRSGAYAVQFPWTPGVEGSGVVERVGPGVTGVGIGDRVAWIGSQGSYATHCVVPAQGLIPVPDRLDLTDAAAVLVQGMTAHFLVSDVAPLAPGSTCLVHAAAGGVGGLLCQLAAGRGATVIGTVSDARKVGTLREAGVDHVVDRSRGDFADQVLRLTGGAGVDVVYDSVGRETVHGSLSCLRPRGTLVLYGQSSGPVRSIDPQALNDRGSLFFTKASLTHYDTTPAALRLRAGQVLSLVADGQLRVRLHARYPLEQAATAHQELESRTTVGKLLLLP